MFSGDDEIDFESFAFWSEPKFALFPGLISFGRAPQVRLGESTFLAYFKNFFPTTAVFVLVLRRMKREE